MKKSKNAEKYEVKDEEAPSPFEKEETKGSEKEPKPISQEEVGNLLKGKIGKEMKERKKKSKKGKS